MSDPRYARWRLLLGPAAEEGLRPLAGRDDLLPPPLPCLDEALAFPYDGRPSPPRVPGQGLARKDPATWLLGCLEDVRCHFGPEAAALLRHDLAQDPRLRQLLQPADDAERPGPLS